MPNNEPALDLPDAAVLASLERKLQLVRDRVTAVATGNQTGLYLYGSGGLGKSYPVLQRLDQLEVPYRLFNSRMTGKGPFRALERAPDAIHVLEGMEPAHPGPGRAGCAPLGAVGPAAAPRPRKGQPLPCWTTPCAASRSATCWSRSRSWGG
jgi:hypothetical protein